MVVDLLLSRSHTLSLDEYKNLYTDLGVRYPNNSLAEDYAFAEFALNKGATYASAGPMWWLKRTTAAITLIPTLQDSHHGQRRR